jgi:peptidoglycan/xylan/chitin deacetylase (PgdA/CDA1 family)
LKTEEPFAGGSRGTNRVVAILGFHKIGEPPPGGWETWFYIPEETFAGYLGDLCEGGWHVIDLAAFLRGLAEPDSLPERTALLTFDDGYRSIRHVALPWLRRFGFPAVLFMPTDFVGGRNDFDADCEPEEDICDWDDLRELERRGVSIQPHGASHRTFSQLDPAEQEIELLRSRTVLQGGLGKPVAVFSFPYGDGGADPQATGRMLSRAGYRAACLYGGGPNRLPIADPYRLTRIAMGPDTDLRAALAHEPVAAP